MHNNIQLSFSFEPSKTCPQNPSQPVITYTPTKGYRVIAAAGLTHAVKNPCLACANRGEVSCVALTAKCGNRDTYLRTIGYGRPAIDHAGDNAAGFGYL